MKTKSILFGAATLVSLAAIGVAAWQSQRQVVTLRVRNAPLQEVLRRIEKQTHQRIEFDRKLDAKITLDVKHAPLAHVLDLISEQAGARWGRTYAVYSSKWALRQLESALQGNSELEAAGWTNIAPRFESGVLMAPEAFGSAGPRPTDGSAPGKPRIMVDEDVKEVATPNGKVRIVTKPGSESGGVKTVQVGPGATGIENNNSGGTPDPQRRSIVVRRTAGSGGITTTVMDGDGRVKTTRTSPDGTLLKEDQWSAARLVLETPLSAKLGDALPDKATPETAAQTARKVRGKFVMYYALDKPPIAAPDAHLDLARSKSQQMQGRFSTNPQELEGDIGARVEAEARQRRLEELSKTPEQQVLRARQKQELQSAQ